MSIKRLNEYIEILKLENPGIYIFINLKTNEFYVGKASVKMYDRVKHHLLGSHNDIIYNLVNSRDTELYVYELEEFYDDLLFNNGEDINFIEYCVMKHLISKGYKSVNNEVSFPSEIKERYNNYINNKLNLDMLIKFELNLFCRNFKEILTYKKKLKYINNVQNRLQYQVNKNMELKKEMQELKCNMKKQKKDYIKNVYKDYYTMKDKLSDLELENRYLKDNLSTIEMALEKLKQTRDTQIKSIEDKLYKEIHEKNIELKNLEYKILSLEQNSYPNLVTKEALIDIISKIHTNIENIYSFISKGTHYRGIKEDYYKYKGYNDRILIFKMFLNDIINNKNILFKLNNFNDKNVVYEVMRYCCNISMKMYELAYLLGKARVEEKLSDDKVKHITVIDKSFLKQYYNVVKNMEKEKEKLEKVLKKV